MDRRWWMRYLGEVDQVFRGERVGLAKLPPRYRVARLEGFKHSNNSGTAAIALAAHRGARRIILLGYDCQHTEGRTHHHGDHPKGLGNAGSVARWSEANERLAPALERAGVAVLNASRATALTCWPRVDLHETLAGG